jgi:mannose-1-phosphate guanylyltransferase/mannose-6-phosphate isomerase
VGAFVEKPNQARARQFLDLGYLWNSGMFMLAAATAQSEFARYAPAIAEAAAAAVAGASVSGNRIALAREPFLSAPKLSVDYAIMEKTSHAAVVEARFDWSDLGTWTSVWESGEKDAAGNIAIGDAVLVDVRDSYVSSGRPKVGVIGLADVMVVATDDAVLVAHRDHADDVKKLVATIDAAPERMIGDFARHHRPWGHYQTIDLGKRHQVKRIVVKPGARLSLQKHFHRAEHWTVVEGVADVTVGMQMEALKITRLNPNEAIAIPLGAIHRMANPGDTPMTLIEVQVGDYLGEDDIVRLQDDYGRST